MMNGMGIQSVLTVCNGIKMNKMSLLYQNYLGLETGDVIKTSYGTTGVIESMSKPRYTRIAFVDHIFIYPQPVLNIRFTNGGGICEVCYRGGIWQHNSGNAQYEVIKPTEKVPMRIDMFESYLTPIDKPYCFQSGVDYDQQYVWNCRECRLDYNHGRNGDLHLRHLFKHGNYCPKCGMWGNNRIFWMGGESFRTTSWLMARDYKN